MKLLAEEPELKSGSISDRVYDQIRGLLLNSDNYPGQKIPHIEIGQRLGISQTPLREAFIRLSAEGFLVHHSQRGFFVPEMEPEEAGELYEIREVIEPFMAKKAVKFITTNHIRSLSKIIRDYKSLISQPYNRKRLLKDREFHMEIATISGNKSLAQILAQVFDRIIIKRHISHLALIRGQDAYEEHLKIYEALNSKDGNKAADLMVNHIMNARDFVLGDILKRQNLDVLNQLSPIK